MGVWWCRQGQVPWDPTGTPSPGLSVPPPSKVGTSSSTGGRSTHSPLVLRHALPTGAPTPAPVRTTPDGPRSRDFHDRHDNGHETPRCSLDGPTTPFLLGGPTPSPPLSGVTTSTRVRPFPSLLTGGHSTPFGHSSPEISGRVRGSGRASSNPRPTPTVRKGTGDLFGGGVPPERRNEIPLLSEGLPCRSEGRRERQRAEGRDPRTWDPGSRRRGPERRKSVGRKGRPQGLRVGARDFLVFEDPTQMSVSDFDHHPTPRVSDRTPTGSCGCPREGTSRTVRTSPRGGRDSSVGVF